MIAPYNIQISAVELTEPKYGLRRKATTGTLLIYAAINSEDKVATGTRYVLCTCTCVSASPDIKLEICYSVSSRDSYHRRVHPF